MLRNWWFAFRWGWLYIHVTRHFERDELARKVAWKLPRHVAYWAFIRVYAESGDAPGPEFIRACEAWHDEVAFDGSEAGYGPGI